MLKSLLARNIALMIITVLLAQLLSGLLIGVLLIKPQTQRLSQIMAHNVAAMSVTMAAVSEPERAALIAKINRGGALRILPATALPPEDRGIPTILETLFVRAFAKEMAGTDTIIWRGGRSGQLWVRVRLSDTAYWISHERPEGLSPFLGLIIALSIALIISLVAGILLQRRLARPLRRLAIAADEVGRGDFPDALRENGPDEIATVARSFNLMNRRLSLQEQDRAFMLAGISHDLRTPLAKIRLALAVGPQRDAETALVLERQLDQMDIMLGQFLDFARGIDAEAFTTTDLERLIIAALALVDVTPPIALECRNPVQVRVQPLNFERALVNLIRNAVKYGAPPIQITISVSANLVDIAILDNGPGVPDDDLARLAQPFVRLNTARPSDGSTGLGLAITKRIIADHGGLLILRNRASGGFEAIIQLPYSQDSG
jgi:two-component system, OmpR family, osmolarity sensor histidine kinase EnvZ